MVVLALPHVVGMLCVCVVCVTSLFFSSSRVWYRTCQYEYGLGIEKASADMIVCFLCFLNAVAVYLVKHYH